MFQSATSLPAFFSDHMVLQREKPVAVWGWDKPGRVVKVKVGDVDTVTITLPSGRFQAMLPPMKAGGPYTMTIDGSGTKTINDVWVGEVWICSGQSNMEFTEAYALDRAQAKQEADPHVRMFTVTKKISNSRMTDVTGSWVPSSADTVDQFSAVGLAFARKLYNELKVPIGIIHTSWGGTPAEAWTSLAMMDKDPMTKNIVDRANVSLAGAPDGLDKYVKAMKVWEVKGMPEFFGPHSEEAAKLDYDDTTWAPAPMLFAFANNYEGTIWFRKEVTLTADQAKSINSISLGAIDDNDMTYVNGEEVGRTDLTTPNWWAALRNYSVRSGLLKAGRNVIAVRAYNGTGPGGFTGPEDQMKLGDISIADGWKMKVEGPKQAPLPDAGSQPQPPMTTNDPNFPETLYNGMLYPLAPFGIRGAIWYQGESNAGRAVQYQSLLADMIKDWRGIFKQEDFSFYIVQLANFMKANPEQFDSAWAELRDAQDAVGQMDHCGTATILDIGNADDIHPKDKRDVGERLARIALKKDYGFTIESQGPRLIGTTVAGGKVTVHLSHATGLKTTDGQAPRAFAIAGADQKWHWAQATIEGSTVVLSSPDVPTPVAVRYGWQDNPLVNLVNSDGLPAMPFRTDKWKLVTQDAR